MTTRDTWHRKCDLCLDAAVFVLSGRTEGQSQATTLVCDRHRHTTMDRHHDMRVVARLNQPTAFS